MMIIAPSHSTLISPFGLQILKDTAGIKMSINNHTLQQVHRHSDAELTFKHNSKHKYTNMTIRAENTSHTHRD